MTSSGIFVTDRSSHQRYSIKELFLKIWQYSQKNHLCSIVFLIKLLAVFSRIPRYFVSLRIQSKCGKMRPATLLKRLSNKGVFLWILANFLKHLFLRTHGCFCTDIHSLLQCPLYFPGICVCLFYHGATLIM